MGQWPRLYPKSRGGSTRKMHQNQSGRKTNIIIAPALEALIAQKTFTFLENKKIFHNPNTQKAWLLDGHIRGRHWTPLLKKAGVRYRNLYQTRHTYASMLLSAGENMLWVAKQMGRYEMVIKTYGKWIPNSDSEVGYQPTYSWGKVLSAI